MTATEVAPPRRGNLKLHVFAFLSGGLLSVMLMLNGLLAERTSPAFASLGAHATGSAVAMVILLAMSRRRRLIWIGTTPVWAFSGGVFGAMIVTVTAIAVNSGLSLAGTLALGLAGQAVFGLVADQFGLFGLPMRRVGWQDLAALLLVFGGSVAFIMSVA